MRENKYSWECGNAAGEIENVDLNELEYRDGNLVREAFYNEKGDLIGEKLY